MLYSLHSQQKQELIVLTRMPLYMRIVLIKKIYKYHPNSLCCTTSNLFPLRSLLNVPSRVSCRRWEIINALPMIFQRSLYPQETPSFLITVPVSSSCGPSPHLSAHLSLYQIYTAISVDIECYISQIPFLASYSFLLEHSQPWFTLSELSSPLEGQKFL